MRNTTIRENGKDVPYAEWLDRETKRLQIKMDCATTAEERSRVQMELRNMRCFDDFVNGRSGDRVKYGTIEHCMKA